MTAPAPETVEGIDPGTVVVMTVVVMTVGVAEAQSPQSGCPSYAATFLMTPRKLKLQMAMAADRTSTFVQCMHRSDDVRELFERYGEVR